MYSDFGGLSHLLFSQVSSRETRGSYSSKRMPIATTGVNSLFSWYALSFPSVIFKRRRKCWLELLVLVKTSLSVLLLFEIVNARLMILTDFSAQCFVLYQGQTCPHLSVSF